MKTFSRTLESLDDGIRKGLHPGYQIYVSLQGETLLDHAAGLATAGNQMTTRTLTLWMSAGKPVTAVALLQQIADGKATLETRACEVIPDFAQNNKESITLGQILTHTAGFRGPFNNFTAGSFHGIVQRACELRLEPGWIPGSKAGYHVGSSWFILGALVERLSGRPLQKVIREDVFGIIDQHDAFLGFSGDDFDRLSGQMSTMFVTDKSPTHDNWPGNSKDATCIPRPGANARGPVRSLGRFYESLLLDDQLLPRPLATQMTTRRRVGMMDHTFNQPLDWGLGVMIDSKHLQDPPGPHTYGFGRHASKDTFGHSGNQSSCAFADPVHQLVVAWTCNGMPGEPSHQQRADEINASIYLDLALV